MRLLNFCLYIILIIDRNNMSRNLLEATSTRHRVTGDLRLADFETRPNELYYTVNCPRAVFSI